MRQKNLVLRLMIGSILVCVQFETAFAVSWGVDQNMNLLKYWILRETTGNDSWDDDLYGHLSSGTSFKGGEPQPNFSAQNMGAGMYNWAYYLAKTSRNSYDFSSYEPRDGWWSWDFLRPFDDEGTHYMIEQWQGQLGATLARHLDDPLDSEIFKKATSPFVHLTMPTGAWPVLASRSNDVTPQIRAYLLVGAWMFEDGGYAYAAKAIEGWVDSVGHTSAATYRWGGDPRGVISALEGYVPAPTNPQFESAYLTCWRPEGTVRWDRQNPAETEEQPHKIVLRDGWDPDAFYALFHLGATFRKSDYKTMNSLHYLVWNHQFWITGFGYSDQNTKGMIASRAGSNSAYAPAAKRPVKFYNTASGPLFHSKVPSGDVRAAVFRKGGALVVFDDVVSGIKRIQWWLRGAVGPGSDVSAGQVTMEQGNSRLTVAVFGVDGASIYEHDAGSYGHPKWQASFPQNTAGGTYQLFKATISERTAVTVLAPHYEGAQPSIRAVPGTWGVVVDGRLSAANLQGSEQTVEGIRTDAELIEAGPLSRIEEIAVLGGSFVEFPLASKPEGVQWVEHEQVPFWENRKGSDTVEAADWTYADGKVRVTYTGSGTIRLEVPTAVLEAQTSGRPKALALKQNYPNPFNSSTMIEFSLPHEMEVDLGVYNLMGQRVATLVAGVRTAGTHTVRWDGRDDGGREVAGGTYQYRLRAGAQVETRKLLLLR